MGDSLGHQIEELRQTYAATITALLRRRLHNLTLFALAALIASLVYVWSLLDEPNPAEAFCVSVWETKKQQQICVERQETLDDPLPPGYERVGYVVKPPPSEGHRPR